nr:MAG TPA: hypothetical protein [Caudoviricetes sp.]
MPFFLLLRLKEAGVTSPSQRSTHDRVKRHVFTLIYLVSSFKNEKSSVFTKKLQKSSYL